MAQRPEQASISKSLEVATFAAGCFWCTEAVFDQLKGVSTVESGYSGGNAPNPSYEEVCTGDTGHAESIEVTFEDRKSTRLNSRHSQISYAVFCLKKKNKQEKNQQSA